MSKIEEGKPAPDFLLPSTEGNPIRLSDLKGKNVVLYFYPKDKTPGCTKEACDFRDSIKRIKEQNAVVLGVSADSLNSHDRFLKQYKLSFPLLSDEGKEVLKKYGVWKEKSFMGRKFMGIERTTVVIDAAGNVQKIFPKVKVEGHCDEVLETLANLKKFQKSFKNPFKNPL
jgi:peroxiredoxin Q/BCP